MFQLVFFVVCKVTNLHPHTIIFDNKKMSEKSFVPTDLGISADIHTRDTDRYMATDSFAL